MRVLIEHQERQHKRILLTNSQRMRVAAKTKRLSRKMLEQCTELFTPDTVMRWYRKLIAEKYGGSQNRTYAGQPPILQEVVDLVIRLKQENPRWGYKKIRDQICYLGFTICKSSVKNILIEYGHDPKPDLTVRSTWHEFIRSHWDVLTACDFFTVELFVGRRVVRCTLFFVMELATRRVFFTPVKLQPDGKYMRQVMRILTDSEDGFLYGKPYLIHDRDPSYRKEGFHATLRSSDIEPVKLPARSPDLNCYAERFLWSIRHECLNKMIIFDERHLGYVIGQYCAYYHHEQIHQGVGRIIEPRHPIDDTADIVCVERLGGLLKSYHRLAA